MNDQNTVVRRLFRHGSFIFGSSTTVAFLALLQGILVARSLGPQAFGIWGVIVSSTALIQGFLGFRTLEPFTRELVAIRAKNGAPHLYALIVTALGTDIATNLFACAAIVLLAPLIGSHIAGGPEATTLLQWYSITVLFSVADAVWYGVARDLHRFPLVASVPLLVAGARLAVIFALSLASALTLTSLALTAIGVSALRFLVIGRQLLRFCRHDYALGGVSFSLSAVGNAQRDLGEFWRFMRTSYVASLISIVAKQGDLLILGVYVSDYALGLYRLASTVAQLGFSAADSLAQVLYQDMNEMVARKEFRTLRDYLRRVLRVWAPAVGVGAVLGVTFAAPLIALMFGEEFRPAAPLCVLLIIGYMVPLLLCWSHPLVLALGAYKSALRASAAANIFYLVGALSVVPLFGVKGMAVITGATWTMAYLLSLAIAVRALRSGDR